MFSNDTCFHKLDAGEILDKNFRSWWFYSSSLFFDRRYLFNWTHFLNAVVIKSIAGKLVFYFILPSCIYANIFNSRHTVSHAARLKTPASLCHTVAAIFTGLDRIDSDDGWLLKVMGGFFAWEVLFIIILEVHDWVVKHRGKPFFCISVMKEKIITTHIHFNDKNQSRPNSPFARWRATWSVQQQFSWLSEEYNPCTPQNVVGWVK